jgi:toxin ParE1/3/4
MAKPAHTSRAEQDLVDIWFEIAKYDTRAADRVMDQIEHSCDVLMRFPHGGEACPKYGHDTRWFPSGNYIIIYRPDDDGIQVIRVIDGRRDIDTAFFQ